MLHRFICGDSLGEDSYKSTDPPEVVIRQVAQSHMEVWDLKRGEVLKYQGSSLGLLRCFDPKKTFYLYEPGRSFEEPHQDELSIPTMCSVSPDRTTYKYFLKKGAVMLYMPTWTLPELKAVGKFALNRSPEQMPLRLEDIPDRFKTVGGIFRHVFAKDFAFVKGEQRRAIQELDPKSFLVNDIDRGRAGVSHFVAQYQVETDGDNAFRMPPIDFVSEEVRNAVEAEFFKMSLSDKVGLLRQSDESPLFLRSMGRGIYAIYEDVIAGRLIQGVRWEKKNLTDSNFTAFDLELTELVVGKLPNYENMTEMVLYKPLNSNYPAIDMMYKKDGLVYGLQVTREEDLTRTIKTSAVDTWLKDIGMENNMDKVRIAVIPRPDLAEESKAKYVGKKGSGYPQLEVWKVPGDYGQLI